MPRRAVLLAVAAAAVLGVVTLSAAGPAARTPAKRVPWTTANVVGSPEPPPPFVVADAFPGLKFNHPLHVTFQADLNRVFVAEQGGPVYSFDPTAAGKRDVFFDPKALKHLDKIPGQNGFETVYGLAFHPQFKVNRTCFVCYTLRGKDGVNNLADGSRVSRFAVTADAVPRASTRRAKSSC